MSKDNVVAFRTPEGARDPLTELLRQGAKHLIQQAAEAALPWLYLKGISTGQMQEALGVLVGPEVKGLSASVSCVTYGGKYPKAVACLRKDRETLLAFYDYPAEHWIHIRTANPIESSFATIRHRTDRAKGCVSRNTMLVMIYKLGMCAEKRRRRIRGFAYLAKIIEGVKFKKVAC